VLAALLWVTAGLLGALLSAATGVLDVAGVADEQPASNAPATAIRLNQANLVPVINFVPFCK
jgi:hypothetical protein